MHVSSVLYAVVGSLCLAHAAPTANAADGPFGMAACGYRNTLNGARLYINPSTLKLQFAFTDPAGYQLVNLTRSQNGQITNTFADHTTATLFLGTDLSLTMQKKQATTHFTFDKKGRLGQGRGLPARYMTLCGTDFGGSDADVYLPVFGDSTWTCPKPKMDVGGARMVKVDAVNRTADYDACWNSFGN